MDDQTYTRKSVSITEANDAVHDYIQQSDAPDDIKAQSRAVHRFAGRVAKLGTPYGDLGDQVVDDNLATYG